MAGGDENGDKETIDCGDRRGEGGGETVKWRGWAKGRGRGGGEN